MAETYDPWYPGQQTAADLLRWWQGGRAMPPAGAYDAPVPGQEAWAAAQRGLSGLGAGAAGFLFPQYGPGPQPPQAPPAALGVRMPQGQPATGFTAPNPAVYGPPMITPDVTGPGAYGPARGGVIPGYTGEKLTAERLPAGGGLPTYETGKGAPLRPPSAVAAERPAAAPGAAPAAGQPSGLMRWREVIDAIGKSNPELMKTKQGHAIIAAAAMQFLPLMHQQDQQELHAIQQRLNMELGIRRVELAEQRLAQAPRRAGGFTAVEASRAYEAAERNYLQAQRAASAPGASKDLKAAAAEAKQARDQMKAYRDQALGVVSTQQADVGARFQEWLKQKPTASQVIESEPMRDIAGQLRTDERQQLVEMLLTDPANAYARIQLLRRKLMERGAGTETTVGKTR